MGTNRKGILLSTAAAFWGAVYLIPYKSAATRADPESLVLAMLLSAAVLNTLPTLLGGKKKLRIDRTSALVALLLGVFSAFGNEAMARALTRIEPGVAAVTLRTQVVLVALGGWWLLKERVGSLFWPGCLLALGGFALLQGDLGGEAGPSPAGVAWVLAAAACFAAMQLIIRKTIHRIEPLTVNSLRLWLAAVLLACIPGRVALLARADGHLWLLAAAAAVSGPVLSRILLMLSVRHITAALSTLVLFLTPVFAFVLGGLSFGHWPSALELAGSLIILVGIALPVVELLRFRLKTPVR